MSIKKTYNSSVFTDTPGMLKARRDIEKSLRGKTGEPVQGGCLPEAWNEIGMGGRTLLRCAHFYNIMRRAVVKDLKNKYVCMSVIGIAALPGPGGIFVVPAAIIGSLASYSFRWDKRGKDTRNEIRNMNSAKTMQKYEPFLKHYRHNKGGYAIDFHSLFQHKVDALKKSMHDVTKTAGTHFLIFYYKKMKPKCAKAVEPLVKSVMKSEERAEKLLNECYDCIAATEVMTGQFIKCASEDGEALAEKCKSAIKEPFSLAMEMKDQCCETLYSGVQYNKHEIKNALSRKPGV